jgi:hypothetical protein
VNLLTTPWLRDVAATTILVSYSQSYLTTDGQSASLSWCQATIWDQRTIFLFSSIEVISRQCGFLITMCPLWREDMSVIDLYNCFWACLRSHSRARVPQNSSPLFTVSFETPPIWRARSPRICIAQGQGGPALPPCILLPFHRLLRWTGLRWRYSNPHPQG